MMRRTTTLMLAAGLLALPAGASGAEEPPDEQLRAYWVDAFNEGVYSEEEVEHLVAQAEDLGANALIVQVGRRFDCFCNESAFPRTDAGIEPAPYDPLATVIEHAHAADIEVHAWINATTLWNQATPPSSEDHAFNQHGPDADGEDRWLAQREDGEELMGANAYIDPGHPDAAAYVVDGVTSIIDAYDVDGVNLDYIRYPDFNDPLYESQWGYNETALEQFQLATGRDDRPAPDDEEFSDWRRAQVTTLVRNIYLDAYAADPSVNVSVNTTTYAFGPQSEGGWEQTRAYSEVLQDWRAWMEEGIVDLNVPMNYKRNWMDDQQQMYEEWNEVIADWQYDRHAVVGSAIYLNEVTDSVAQVRSALEPTVAGNEVVGWVGYSYATPSLSVLEGRAEADEERAALAEALTEDDPHGEAPAFGDPAVVPEMVWKTQPTKGHVAGDVVTADDGPVAQAVVELIDRETGEVVSTTRTNGTGWFGFVDADPGRYLVRLAPGRTTGPPVEQLEVEAGAVTEVALRPRGQR
jgi:uncharacterized lipoprotein YddW (UPF0748 family)